MAAFGPTEIRFLNIRYDLFSPLEVVSFFKVAVPSLNNSLDCRLSVEA